MLILKGLSNKEIANVRSASEMTIKQQASAIYRKSGIANRSQLLAFFLVQAGKEALMSRGMV
jgi:DNA-binding NarL/FixJ family response regulator